MLGILPGSKSRWLESTTKKSQCKQLWTSHSWLKKIGNKRSRKFLKIFWNFFEVFAEIRRKNSILVIVRAHWHVQEVERYALSKFQPPTTLGDHQNVGKTIRTKIDFFGFWKSVFRNFSWIFEGIDNFRRQNQTRQITSYNVALRPTRFSTSLLSLHVACVILTKNR